MFLSPNVENLRCMTQLISTAHDPDELGTMPPHESGLTFISRSICGPHFMSVYSCTVGKC